MLEQEKKEFIGILKRKLWEEKTGEKQNPKHAENGSEDSEDQAPPDKLGRTHQEET